MNELLHLAHEGVQVTISPLHGAHNSVAGIRLCVTAETSNGVLTRRRVFENEKLSNVEDLDAFLLGQIRAMAEVGA